MSHGTVQSHRRDWKRLLKDRRGQVSILVGSMTLTFLMFTTFVINVGMLVNAKINLQNAADMAAYAGAAVQARHLTQISYLNYELRRQYKKFLFRYYVMGNMAQASHPRNPINGERKWTPNGAPGQPAVGLGIDNKPIRDFVVPSTCVMFGSKDNPCAVGQIDPIKFPAAGVLDTIGSALHDQLNAIEKIRLNNCGAIGATNTQIMNYWLYNTDPELKTIQDSLGNSEANDQLKLMKSLIRGMGLVPRAFLLNSRIDTLQKYVNQPPKTGLTKAALDALISQGDAAKNERTFQAFVSAFNSLGNNTFDQEDRIQMDEILPEQILDLKPTSINFDVYVTQFAMKPVGAAIDECSQQAFENADATKNGSFLGPMACYTCPYPVPVKLDLRIAWYKNPDVLTYYAVRLQAPAKIMFNPFGGDLTLKAYSAAQPFGSRIGPQLSESDFVRAGAKFKTCDWVQGGCKGQVPNLAIFEGDGAGSPAKLDQGWNTNKVIRAMYKKFSPEQTTVERDLPVNATNIERALHAAMVPNPWEQGKYNIPVMDAAKGSSKGMANLPDAYQQNFTVEKGYMAFWAPLKSEGNLDKAELEQMLKTMFQPDPSLPGGGANRTTMPPLVQEALLKGLTRYIEDLKKGVAGEDNEGFNIVRLTDPFNSRPIANSAAPRVPISFVGTGADTLMLQIDPAKPQNVKSSFVGNRDSAVEKLGRIGYSVKYVPLRSLAGQGPANTSSGNLMNGIFTSDSAKSLSDIEADVEGIQH